MNLEERKGHEKLTVWISKPFHQRLRVYCAVNGTPMGKTVEQACNRLFDNDKNFKKNFGPHLK